MDWWSCLYGLGQSSPYELAFEVDLGSLHGISARFILVWAWSMLQLGLGEKGGVKSQEKSRDDAFQKNVWTSQRQMTLIYLTPLKKK